MEEIGPWAHVSTSPLLRLPHIPAKLGGRHADSFPKQQASGYSQGQLVVPLVAIDGTILHVLLRSTLSVLLGATGGKGHDDFRCKTRIDLSRLLQQSQAMRPFLKSSSKVGPPIDDETIIIPLVMGDKTWCHCHETTW